MGEAVKVEGDRPTRFDWGEVYVWCAQCGAKLWSDDAKPGEESDRILPCPYKGKNRLCG